MTIDVAVIGAGPYGLSAAAHLRRIEGLKVHVLGEPMEFWKSQMPEGMFLRSPWEASNLSDPDASLDLNAFRNRRSEIPVPIPLDDFVSYGLWFQEKAVGEIDRRRVSRIDRVDDGYRLTLNDGDTIVARRVVVASGIGPFARRLEPFRGLPASLVTHSADARDVQRFRGRKVFVIGAGQSALETAALIHEVGGHVEIIARTPAIHWLGWRARIQRYGGPFAKLLYSPYDIGTAGVSRIVALPNLVKYFPRKMQNKFRTRALRPAGARWLIDRLKAVPKTTGRTVKSAVANNGGVRLMLDDGSVRDVHHVVMGTGYRVDISQYPFLPAELSRRIDQAEGFPLLKEGFESSLPAFHFLGAPAAWTYGPLMYFVAGTDFAARTLARFVNKAHPPAAR